MEQRKDERRITALNLSGTPRQVGRAHGAAAKAEGALEGVGFYGRFLDTLFDFDIASEFEAWLRRVGRGIVREWVERSFIERIPSRYRETLEGFSEGSGFPIDPLLRAYVMPDVCSYLLGRRFLLSPRSHSHAPAQVGCTSIVGFRQPRTREGILHGRNLDYPGGEFWARFPTLTEYTPEEGHRYVSVTSLGIETAGITAMNEAGLTLALHMNYSRKVRTSGVPVAAIGHEVIRRASTLESAVEILRSFPWGGGWTFVIGSHRERSALAVEGDAGGIILRRLERSALVATNHFTDRELASRQSWTTHGRRIDSEIRFRRAEEILFGGNLPLEVSRMASILGDSHDPESGRERAFGGTIAQAHTISSVIFDPGEKRVYLASGEIPVSKGCYSAYRCFPGPVPTEGDLPSEPFSAKRAGRARYLEAFHRYFPTGDFQGVREDLERAREADPQESLYPFLLGLFHLKAVDPERALHWIEQAERLHEVDWRKSLFRLFRARALDLAGRRKEGVEVYRSLCGDPLYSRPARRGMRRPWSGRESRKLRFDFMTGEPFGSG